MDSWHSRMLISPFRTVIAARAHDKVIARERMKYTRKLTVTMHVACASFGAEVATWWRWREFKRDVQAFLRIANRKRCDTGVSKSMIHRPNRILLSENDYTWWSHGQWITIMSDIHPLNTNGCVNKQRAK